MTRIAHGKVQGSTIVFAEPLPLPDGTEVVVHLEVEKPVRRQHFSALPFFGMYAERPEMQYSVAWLRRERERWQQRLAE